MLGFRLVCKPVCAGVAASHRLIARPLAGCFRTFARQPMVASHPFQRAKLRRAGVRICATSESFDDIVESTPGLIEELNSELRALDEAVVEWQQRVALSQGQQEKDMHLLAELTEEVKADQQAWQCEIDELDALMSCQANVEMSNQEIQEMQERAAVLKRKVQLFQNLLQERNREVESLRTQLEDLHQMGELKRIKQERAGAMETVMAGTVAAASQSGAARAYPGERRLPSFTTPSSWVSNPDGVSSPWAPVPAKDGNAQLQRKISTREVSQRKAAGKFETPGLLVLSGILLASRMGGDVWKTVEQYIPEKYHILVRIAGVSSIAMLLASTFSLGL